MTKPKYFQEAERLLGTQEIAGKKHNEDILSLWVDAEIPGGASTDETPWCAAFVNGCLVRGNKAGTKSGLARSFLWEENADKFEKLKKPEKYCIAVMGRNGSNWQGHVGFVKDFDKDYIYLLGGNQKNGANVTRYPRASFNGTGLGFVKPRANATDVTTKQLEKDSRQLKVGSWYERLTLALTGAATAAFQFIADFKQFVTDNWGFAILGTLALVLLVNKTHQWYLTNAYKDGRYLPKAHE